MRYLLCHGGAGRGLDEDDLAVAGGDVEGGHALHAVDERIEVALLDAGAGPSRASRPGSRPRPGPWPGASSRTSCAWPAARSASTAALPAAPASGASPWSASMRSARNASSAQYCRKTWTGRPSAAAPAAITAAALSLSSVPRKSTRESGLIVHQRTSSGELPAPERAGSRCGVGCRASRRAAGRPCGPGGGASPAPSGRRRRSRRDRPVDRGPRGHRARSPPARPSASPRGAARRWAG